MSFIPLVGVNVTTTINQAGFDDTLNGSTNSYGKITFNYNTLYGVWEEDYGDYGYLIVDNVNWFNSSPDDVPSRFMEALFDDSTWRGDVGWVAYHNESSEFTINNNTYKLIVDYPAGGNTTGTLQILVETVSLDDILSHLADINWPYPTGTIQYFDKTYVSSAATAKAFVGEYRYSGDQDSPQSETSVTYSFPAHKTRDVSKSIIWNTNIVDTSKTNSCTIDMNNTYIDIVGYFYLKTAQTTSSTWTFAYIPNTVIGYYQCNAPVWVSNGLWQDESASFSGIYLTRSGTDDTSTEMVQIRGIGVVRKDKTTTGVATGYANYFQLRLIPLQSAASTNFTLTSYKIEQTIEE